MTIYGPLCPTNTITRKAISEAASDLLPTNSICLHSKTSRTIEICKT